ncbi:MAG TPA: DUF2127 domain-containing protein [Methylomirabilota bacterium]|nr:DUF2127 domain-containing protein [Methylomirabilota bacterium]
MSQITSQIFARRSDAWVRLIAVFKLVKGLLLLALGIGVATFLYSNVAHDLRFWTDLVSLRRENRYVRNFLVWLVGIDRQGLTTFEIGTFTYSALLFTEGVGLLLLKRWAEYLTVIITASFIPLELLSNVRRFSVGKTLVVFLNIAAVWYLCSRLWRRPQNR